MKSKRIVVGLSGGVDSSIALLLLKRQGWEPVGVSLKLAHWENKENVLGENACCTVKSLNIARNMCKTLDVPYHTYNVSKEFKKDVMDYFIDTLKEAKTPNPCVICNRYLKFAKLFEWAHAHGIEYVATGHYAKTKLNEKTGKYELLRPEDLNKDQTYGLSFLSQEWLKYIVFPLADYTKDEVYKTAEKEGFEIFLKRKQSQDLCFVSSKALPKYLEEQIGKRPGPIKNEKGEVIGQHKGLHFHTLGQRKGLGLSEKYFVQEFDRKENALIVGKDKKAPNKEVILRPFNFLSAVPKDKQKVLAKVRYREPLSNATIYPPENDKVRVVFDKPGRFITSGQFCVFYKDDVCLGSGIIS